jgi:D-inositol-3-phosphate glycosyltransferase
MKILYLQELASDIELQKERFPAKFRIDGASVYSAQAVRAIVRYSTYDLLLFPRGPFADTGDLRRTDLFADSSHRIRFVNERELARAPRSSQLVLGSLRVELEDLARIRNSVVRRKSPCSGVIHSLYGTSMLHGFVGLFLSTLGKQDALMCSSAAGQQAVRNIFLYIGDRFKQIGANLQCPPIQLPIIPLGIDPEAYEGTDKGPRDSLRILYIGRLSSGSKADLFPLLVAWKDVHSRFRRARLIIAGDDSHRLSVLLRGFAQDLECSNSVDIISNPSRDEKLALYAGADVFVSPSDTLQETFGLTIIEAMAAGLPVIASDWSGYRDIVSNGKTGFLVPTLFPNAMCLGDRDDGSALPSSVLSGYTAVDVRALRDAMLCLLADRDRRMSFRAAALSLVRERFAWKVVIRLYEELWQHLTDIANGPGDDTPQLGLDRFSPAKLFGHYASCLLSDDIPLRRGVGGMGRSRMAVIKAAVQGCLTQEQIIRILDELKDRQLTAMELRAKIDLFQRLDTNEFLAQVCRLLKYGLVEPAQTFSRNWS